MNLVNIVIKDNKNKIYQRLFNLRGETEELITSNVASIINIGLDVNMHSIEFNQQMTELEKRDWKEDDGLYERLLLIYQNKTGKLLTRWK